LWDDIPTGEVTQYVALVKWQVGSALYTAYSSVCYNVLTFYTAYSSVCYNVLTFYTAYSSVCYKVLTFYTHCYCVF
jgi:hypothetical protein